MSVIEVGGRSVGDGQPAFVVAEIGLNHNGDVRIAEQLVRGAATAGSDAVKFQKRDSRALLTADAYDAPYDSPQAYGATYGEHREALELTVTELAELKALAESLGVVFLISAWDKPSVAVCEELGVVAYKVASADVTNHPLLQCLAATAKPLVMSTGMSTQQEVAQAVALVRAHHDDLILLHCVSTYPTEFAEINLSQMLWLRDEFGCPVGYSGHERGIAVSAAAVAMGACLVERHFTLDRTMKGPDHAASLELPGLSRLVRDIRAVEAALGAPASRLSTREQAVRNKLGKSIVTTRPLDAGASLASSDLAAKSPGVGMPPYRMHEVVGRRLQRSVALDHILQDSDLEEA